jgi:hypothetical protein
MYKKFPLLLCAMFLGLTVASCEKEEVISVAPKYYPGLYFTTDAPHTITLENQNNVTRIGECNAGDSVTVFIPVLEPGAYITRADYFWQLRKADKTILEEIKIRTVAPHRETVPPMWRFKAPDTSDTYSITFRVEYNYSALTADGYWSGNYPMGNSYEGANTLESKLTVK